MLRGVALALVLLLGACAPEAESEAGMESAVATSMRLSSSSFEPGQPIPAQHTCDGADESPPLEWSGAPAGTQAFALLVTDPDARGFVHWVLVDLPADTTGLPAGEGDSIGTPGRNDFGRVGWGGPCPPSGTHRYVFRLYALSAPLELAGTPDAVSVSSQLETLTLDEAELVGTYSRG